MSSMPTHEPEQLCGTMYPQCHIGHSTREHVGGWTQDYIIIEKRLAMKPKTKPWAGWIIQLKYAMI